MNNIERIARSKMPPNWEPDLLDRRDLVGGVFVDGAYSDGLANGRPRACIVCDHELKEHVGLSLAQETKRWVMALRDAVADGLVEEIDAAAAQVEADSALGAFGLVEMLEKAALLAADARLCKGEP